MTGTRQLESVRGVGFVLGRRPQMFIILVLWSDGSDSLIYRTFQEFRQFHKRLKNNFPLEAGLLKSSDCVLPKLQDASGLLSGRTRRGLVRLQLLEAYSQKLLGAPEMVSQSEVVTGFFQPQPGDLEPVLPQNSLGNGSPERSHRLSKGLDVEMNLTSLKKQGMKKSLVIMPSSFERPERSPKKPLALEPGIHSLEAQTFLCLHSFSTQDTRGRPFEARAGEELDVLLKEATGWWLVENEDKQTAWFPAPYLEEASTREGCKETPPIPCSGRTFFTTRAHQSSREDELSVPSGARVTVLQESECGWWQCRYQGRLGLLPAVLLCPDSRNAGGLGMLLGATRANVTSKPSNQAEAELERGPREGRLPLQPQPTNPNQSSDPDSGSNDGKEGRAAAGPSSRPVVPPRPKRGDILQRCCSVTCRALVCPEAQRSPTPPLAKPLLATSASAHPPSEPDSDCQVNPPPVL